MLNNIVLKNILKSTVYKPISMLNKCCSKDDKIILLYISTLGIRHNLAPILDYLINNGYNKKYKIVCAIENNKYSGVTAENVFYISKLKAHLYFIKAKNVFYTAGQLPIKPSKNQNVIHLTHGALYYKAMGKLSNINNGDEFYFTKMLVTCEYFKKIVMDAYGCGEDNLLVCNEPMTDCLFKKETTKKEKDIVLFWLPTFRQSKELGYNNSSCDKPLILFDDQDYEKLNDYLKEIGIKIIAKMHTAQNVSENTNRMLSNLHIYTHKEFTDSKLDIYKIMRECDGLIGDYSSASLQFLLLDKPQLFVIPDIEDYKKNRGFVFNNPLDFMPGAQVKTKDDFFRAMKDIAEGNDKYVEERKKVKNLLHAYQDGNACKRILDYCGIKK